MLVSERVITNTNTTTIIIIIILDMSSAALFMDIIIRHLRILIMVLYGRLLTTMMPHIKVIINTCSTWAQALVKVH